MMPPPLQLDTPLLVLLLYLPLLILLLIPIGTAATTLQHDPVEQPVAATNPQSTTQVDNNPPTMILLHLSPLLLRRTMFPLLYCILQRHPIILRRLIW